jgi:hypothetical protein
MTTLRPLTLALLLVALPTLAADPDPGTSVPTASDDAGDRPNVESLDLDAARRLVLDYWTRYRQADARARAAQRRAEQLQQQLDAANARLAQLDRLVAANPALARAAELDADRAAAQARGEPAVGMTYAEIVQLMGEPRQKGTTGPRDSRDTWAQFYRQSEIERIVTPEGRVIEKPGRGAYFTVKFRDGVANEIVPR